MAIEFDGTIADEYTKVVNYLSAAETPKALHEHMAVRGISLVKPGAPGQKDGQRPIGVPEIHFRVVSSLYMVRGREDLNATYKPVQQAMNPRGAEILIHAMRAAMVKLGKDPDQIVMQLDFMNAFNEMNRAKFLVKMIEDLPEIACYLYAEYGAKKKMVFDEGVRIVSDQGLIQGENAGPGCCMSNERTLLKDLKSMLDDDHFIGALMDDITIIAPQDVAKKALEFVEKNGPAFGFHINRPKTNIIPISPFYGVESTPKSPEWSSNLAWVLPKDENGEIIWDKYGFRQLGSYFGRKPFVTSSIKKKIDSKFKPLARLIVLMRNPHCAWIAMKRLPAIVGLDFVLRTTPPELVEDACTYFDSLIKDLFETAVVRKVLTKEEWELAQLPTPVGWGLTPTRIKSIAGYTASLNTNFSEIVDMRNDAVNFLHEELDRMVKLIESYMPPNTEFKFTKNMKQKDIVKLMLRKNEIKFANHDDQRVRVLYKQQNDRKAQAIKTSFRPNLVMEPDEFETFAQRSLGVNLIPEPQRCLVCGTGTLDVKGDHDCSQGGATIKRHNIARDHYFETARQGFVPCSREKTIYYTKGEVISYRPDITFDEPIPGLTQKKTASDFSFHHAFAKSYIKTADNKEEGALANQVDQEKEKLHLKALNENGYDFLPLGLESMATLSEKSQELAYYLIGQQSKQQGVPFAEAAAHFWYKLSFLIHRHSARCILSRIRHRPFKPEKGWKESKKKKNANKETPPPSNIPEPATQHVISNPNIPCISV